jgi:hypothetical protein
MRLICQVDRIRFHAILKYERGAKNETILYHRITYGR